MKTLADLLQEDDAHEGDVYEAVGQRWTLATDCKRALVMQADAWLETMRPGVWRRIPADGWKRVSREPRVVEFKSVVKPHDAITGGTPFISLHASYEDDFVGKRVRVRVTELREGDEPLWVEEVIE